MQEPENDLAALKGRISDHMIKSSLYTAQLLKEIKELKSENEMLKNK